MDSRSKIHLWCGTNGQLSAGRVDSSFPPCIILIHVDFAFAIRADSLVAGLPDFKKTKKAPRLSRKAGSSSQHHCTPLIIRIRRQVMLE